MGRSPGERSAEPDRADHASSEPGGAPESPQPLNLELLLTKLAFARSESAQVMAAIDSDTENARNLVYRLAQVNLTLNEVITELLRAVAGRGAGR
jgi:hypothetical protein